MIAVELSRIIIDEEKKEQVIVLKERSGERLLPIVIGNNEAQSIKIQISEFSPSRPLTHDLMSSIITTFGAHLVKVIIDDLVDGTFYAKLHFNHASLAAVIDARPSDSIALALRLKSPVFVEEQVFAKLR